MPAMDHSQMDHSGHMGHGGDGMADMCSMSVRTRCSLRLLMLFTWDTTNLCIVFERWHIRSTPGLVASLIAVVLIAMGYEGLRATSRIYERSIDARVESAPSESRISSQSSVFSHMPNPSLPFANPHHNSPCCLLVYVPNDCEMPRLRAYMPSFLSHAKSVSLEGHASEDVSVCLVAGSNLPSHNFTQRALA
ncbi:ctr copper transporter [Cordyceps javanica]|uniref:Copper transport protein n=1 Tax=Cordyceps javanica TaxID=43265 RepID=A0A545VDK4_9HYPO|nr:ctr copper transporter [Cordyceps javanica]